MALRSIFIFGLLALLLCSVHGNRVSKDLLATLEEVTEQLESAREAQEDEEPGTALMQPLSSIIYSGNTVAFQAGRGPPKWAGCAGTPCNLAGCPGVYMDPPDYNCWGEVFRIYRRSGPGAVRVGDYVGIYYPREHGRWLGCPGPLCAKATCPGMPTLAHGFANEENWHHCWGEVFKIYADRKGLGSIITHKDDIMLYYLRGRDWLSHPGPHLHHNPCPAQARPPPHSKYDHCWGEVFTIWKRGLTTNEL